MQKHVAIKLHGPIFQIGSPSPPPHLKNHHSKDVNLKCEFKNSSRLDVRNNLNIAAAYILLCKNDYGFNIKPGMHL